MSLWEPNLGPSARAASACSSLEPPLQPPDLEFWYRSGHLTVPASLTIVLLSFQDVAWVSLSRLTFLVELLECLLRGFLSTFPGLFRWNNHILHFSQAYKITYTSTVLCFILPLINTVHACFSLTWRFFDYRICIFIFYITHYMYHFRIIKFVKAHFFLWWVWQGPGCWPPACISWMVDHRCTSPHLVHQGFVHVRRVLYWVPSQAPIRRVS